MKVGDRVYALISLHRTGVPVSANERGTILEYLKPKKSRRKTGFGTESFTTSGRAKVRWDRGVEGWHDLDVLGT